VEKLSEANHRLLGGTSAASSPSVCMFKCGVYLREECLPLTKSNPTLANIYESDILVFLYDALWPREICLDYLSSL